jgi:hypothetical protein
VKSTDAFFRMVVLSARIRVKEKRESGFIPALPWQDSFEPDEQAMMQSLTCAGARGA